ncbi:hypothetical protein PF007_g13890 [Phytophthora fragariae]|uniref:Uncharacterized protein n=1 Tax=Phytophthora fragariae TaxID=53985 RepID=A0A6A4DMK1_9STRA|nr:hypothetical protein PF003_g16530 [Phytophthora fragariae]KAE8935479.1 hypothetical protein PF009_g14578 [Phytophthora fragariae]KAE9104899.1 hypothetical protein PF007_g13890 [Phytophthora fragariae]KAE9142046.1 hypothetical protein PF006_g12821 [Phytophthora fragariae]KAE9304623.1 hypothetical protein PF001_g12978 [Phytophthora fragariae]
MALAAADVLELLRSADLEMLESAAMALAAGVLVTMLLVPPLLVATERVLELAAFMVRCGVGYVAIVLFRGLVPSGGHTKPNFGRSLFIFRNSTLRARQHDHPAHFSGIVVVNGARTGCRNSRQRQRT